MTKRIGEKRKVAGNQFGRFGRASGLPLSGAPSQSLGIVSGETGEQKWSRKTSVNKVVSNTLVSIRCVCAHLSFLGLLLVLQDAHVSYSTFRKPLNSYCYIPADSNHACSVRRGIICTELIRLLRTNLGWDAFYHQVCVFINELKLRGFAIV